MANVLKMAVQQAIAVLWRRRWSFRRIAGELGVHRDTVSKYVKVALAGAKPANVTAGDEGAESAKPANPTMGTSGPKSKCELFRDLIVEKLESGLSAQRIYQDLEQEHDFPGNYQSVKRFMRLLRGRSPLPFRRMECEPGAEAQLDFGKGAPMMSVRRRITLAGEFLGWPQLKPVWRCPGRALDPVLRRRFVKSLCKNSRDSRLSWVISSDVE